MSGQDPIVRGLERVYGGHAGVLDRVIDVEALRLVLLSDVHKGQRDGADDFEKCEPAYNAALDWYQAQGFTLVLMGDVEELWECRPRHVLGKYQAVFQREAAFHPDRYVRIYGNHDDEWMSPGSVASYLHPLFRDLQVYEGMRLQVTSAGATLGTILLLHGHQGTIMSDRGRWLARWVVRNLWRPVQRLLRVSLNTPAKSFELRAVHERKMHAWAESKNAPGSKLVLIAGHTHRPVFMSLTHAAQLREKLALVRTRLGTAPQDPALRDQARDVAFLLEQLGAQRDAGAPEAAAQARKPCYFNTGCCCFSDGDITGIELAEGQIRLVRWPDDLGRPLPKIQVAESLTSIFGRL